MLPALIIYKTNEWLAVLAFMASQCGYCTCRNPSCSCLTSTAFAGTFIAELNAIKEQDMEALIQHITKVAVADTKLFFEPFVAVYKFIKSHFNRNAVKR